MTVVALVVCWTLFILDTCKNPKNWNLVQSFRRLFMLASCIWSLTITVSQFVDFSGKACPVIGKINIFLYTLIKYFLYCYLHLKAQVLRESLNATGVVEKVVFGIVQLILLYPIITPIFYQAEYIPVIRRCLPAVPEHFWIIFVSAIFLESFLSLFLLHRFTAPLKDHVKKSGMSVEQFILVVRVSTICGVTSMVSTITSWSTLAVLFARYKDREFTFKCLPSIAAVDVIVCMVMMFILSNSWIWRPFGLNHLTKYTCWKIIDGLEVKNESAALREILTGNSTAESKLPASPSTGQPKGYSS